MYRNGPFDEKVLSTVEKYSLNGPAMRNIYLRKSREEYNAGHTPESIYYQIKSLCVTTQSQYFEDKEKTYFESQLTDSPDFEPNELIKFAKKYVEEMEAKLHIENQKNCEKFVSEENPKTGYQHIVEFCKELPKEWTVIHLCKEFCPKTTYSSQSEILSEETSIFLTMLKYPTIDTSTMKPFCIYLKNEEKSIFKKIFEVVTNLNSKIHFDGKDTKRNRYKFWGNLGSLNNEIEEVIEEFKNFLGPWICLFTGDIRCSDKIEEENISSTLNNLVRNFSQKYNLNNETTNILNVIIRRTNLLSELQIREICDYLVLKIEKENNHDQKILHNEIYEFLNETKTKFNFKTFDYSPCILIIDENVDHLFWEMLNPEQEFYRMSSFSIFKKLFNKYKDRLHQGYLMMSIKNGNCIINPDNSLDKMEKRMSVFFKYWLTHWKCLTGKIPSVDYLEYIQTADCFVYCGHGSGLQFLSGRHITKLRTNSIVFLLGCSSVHLKSDGLHAEMIGPHIYYHAALCPAIVGNLLPALDYQLDNLSTTIFSMWISSTTRKTHWLRLNKKQWEDGKDVSESDLLKNFKSSLPEFEPRLGKILTYIRSNHLDHFYNRINLVLRGLPIYNDS